jgi:hypothetical protein
VAVDEAGVLRGVRHIESRETASYIEGIDTWLAGLGGWNLDHQPLDLEHYDALSGATVTSRAALETVNRAAVAATRVAFGRELAGGGATGRPLWRDPAFLVTLLLLLAFFPVYRSGADGPRLLYQAATLAVLGLWLNTLLTENDLLGATTGSLPGLGSAPHWWLLAGFALLGGALFGQVYCGYVCPFGALQELLSRLGRRLGLRRYAARPLDTRLRQLKFLLLGVMLLAAWAEGDPRWARFNPMQHLFGGRLAGWMAVVTGLSLLGALVYYRFWCRYLCPFGAFLALFNKLALAQRLGPFRRFEHCDLGVRDAYDVDCIRCHRCVSGRDFGVRRPSPGG